MLVAIVILNKLQNPSLLGTTIALFTVSVTFVKKL